MHIVIQEAQATHFVIQGNLVTYYIILFTFHSS